MNYLKQLNGFWAYSESKDLTATEIAVYFGLLHYNNKLNWLSPFVCHHAIICQYTRVSVNTYYSNMKSLMDKGFIIFKKGERNKFAPKVSIIDLTNKTGTILINEQEQDEELIEEQKSNLYKQLTKKTIKLLNNHTELINNNLEGWLKDSNEMNNKYTKNNCKLSTKPYQKATDVSISDLKDELMKDAGFYDFVIKTAKIDVVTINQLLGSFISEQTAIKKTYANYSDFANHFKNWLIKNKDKYLLNKHLSSKAKLLGEEN